MSWLFDLHTAQPVAQAIAVLALVCVAGLAIGSIKIRGIGLRTAGVLFAGLIAGQQPSRSPDAGLRHLIAGSMTDPPALTFVNGLARSDAAMLSYVTVYPLTTLLRILAAQVLALTLFR